MPSYVQTTKNHLQRHTDVYIGIGIIMLIILVAGLFALYIHSKAPNIVYQPTKACELLKPAEAQDLLGDRVIAADTNDPKISGDIATSKCSYTDTNEDQESLIITAVAVRTGINDAGDMQNKRDFNAAKSNNKTEDVKNVGDAAYFNKTNGQLNVLRKHDWIIMSYGVGAFPQTNTIERNLQLAQKVLN